MELNFKGQDFTEIQFNLLVETYVGQQAFLRLFLKYNSKSQEEHSEMTAYYFKAHAEEYDVLMKKLYTDYGHVDVEPKDV